MAEPNELFIAYALWQIDLARSHAARGATVVCLDFLVERELKKQNIAYLSLRDIVDSETEEEAWWLLAPEVAREWYRLPTMKFFEYQGIRIGEVVEPILEEYLCRLFYYVRVYTALKKKYPQARLSIPARIVRDEPTDACLISIERRVVIDAARIAGLRTTVLSKPLALHKRISPGIGKSLLVEAYNLFMSFASRLPAGKAGRRLKIYAGEYWSHIAPIIEHMNECEIVLMESDALTHIPWRQLIKHRIRVRHPNDEICAADRSKAVRISKDFVRQWETATKEVAEYLASVRGELDWSPVIEACEYLMAYAPRAIADIDALRRIMEEEKPDVVLQSASVAGRHHHFFIMARVAAQLKIPSIELQHGINSIDPRTVISRVETDYLASYGAYTNSWYARISNPSSRLIAIGSPRFDQYAVARAGAREKGKQLFKQLGLDTTRPVLLVAVPYSDANPVTFDSYQLAEFFETIHTARSAVPDVQVLFKFRRDKYIGMMQEYLKELFHADYAIAGSEELFALLCASDAVVCGNSTVIYEAMLAQKPLILYPWKSFDTYNARVFAPAAPLIRAAGEVAQILARIFTDALYRGELMKRQNHFLEGYSFDGKASERMVELIGRFAQK